MELIDRLKIGGLDRWTDGWIDKWRQINGEVESCRDIPMERSDVNVIGVSFMSVRMLFLIVQYVVVQLY